jgi:N-acetylmuramoyl-L-alanine amidase
MPAVLVETGYINNPGEEAYLNSTAGQQAIADAIVKAIKRYRDKVDTE